MNPLLRLFSSQPQLLLTHASGYVALVREEGERSVRLLCQRACWLALAYASLSVGATLTGVALMLVCAGPLANVISLWILVVVPTVPLMLGLWALLQANRIGPMPLWEALRKQLDIDQSLFAARTP